MSTRTVTTKEELKKAKEDGVDEIIVLGELAKDLNDAQMITTLSSGAIAALTVAIAAAGAGVAAAPFTGGVSLLAPAASATTIAITCSLTVPAIILASFFGVAMLVALFKEYNFSYDKDGMSATLNKKQ